MPSVSIVGAGRVGGALAIALTKAGYRLDNLVHRGSRTADRISASLSPATVVSPSSSFPKIDSEIVLITTADPDIGDAAAVLADRLVRRPVVLHTSGSLSSDVLSNLAELGCATGSMHPLVSISDAVSGSTSFAGTFFCIEGVEAAQETARSIVDTLGGRSFSIGSDYKTLYHAAAVTACGHLVALIDAAIEMLTKCGIDRGSAQEILLPLIKSTIANLETQTPEQALTGTFARADVATFERHMTAMERNTSSELRDVYLLLGERSLDLAEANGANRVDIEKIRESISMAKRKSE